ncbi:unnamed protein product [Allacma fusca]|uniref:Uncharacterized protein n=1 Tax=Allacma fusca TaxID=39272 RepID=A0A8J2L4R6_9HEXA|nr:unnamed protein product [Allacma fusca]
MNIPSGFHMIGKVGLMDYGKCLLSFEKAHGRRNFTLKYDTNIPRQADLAGSSAIVTTQPSKASLKAEYEFSRELRRDG